MNRNEESNMKTNEEDTIITENEEFRETWNKGDAKGTALLFTEDAVRVGPFGDIQHGRAEIEVAYDRLLHQTMSGTKVKLERGTVRMLSTEFAIWQGGIEIIPPNGGPSLKGYVVQVMKKVTGRWLILEAHPKFFSQY